MARIHHLKRRIRANDVSLPTTWEITREQYADRLQRLQRSLRDRKDTWRRGRIGDVIYTAFMTAQLQQRDIRQSLTQHRCGTISVKFES